jgi:hypothetical protein
MSQCQQHIFGRGRRGKPCVLLPGNRLSIVGKPGNAAKGLGLLVMSGLIRPLGN